MAIKQISNSERSPDGGSYGCFTDGVGNLLGMTTTTLGTSKQSKGQNSPDGSWYMTITNGTGILQ